MLCNLWAFLFRAAGLCLLCQIKDRKLLATVMQQELRWYHTHKGSTKVYWNLKIFWFESIWSCSWHRLNSWFLLQLVEGDQMNFEIRKQIWPCFSQLQWNKHVFSLIRLKFFTKLKPVIKKRTRTIIHKS